MPLGLNPVISPASTAALNALRESRSFLDLTVRYALGAREWAGIKREQKRRFSGGIKVKFRRFRLDKICGSGDLAQAAIFINLADIANS